ncbi:hypothetical protein V7S43_013354 [Phytophthora oleae]|uniref:Uncharacterized protein n=1 Tax=Phytophthora oleae TaxID=2107226 RepID=A0ABD3F973_9STRA
MMRKLEDFKRHFMLPAPLGTTFGPTATALTRAASRDVRAAETRVVQPMEVDDLRDLFEMESRIRDENLNQQRRALRRDQQRHY